MRANIIEQVLATDMKRHFNILSRFQVSCSAVPLRQQSLGLCCGTDFAGQCQPPQRCLILCSHGLTCFVLLSGVQSAFHWQEASPLSTAGSLASRSSRSSSGVLPENLHLTGANAALAGGQRRAASVELLQQKASVWDTLSQEDRGLARQVGLQT